MTLAHVLNYEETKTKAIGILRKPFLQLTLIKQRLASFVKSLNPFSFYQTEAIKWQKKVEESRIFSVRVCGANFARFP